MTPGSTGEKWANEGRVGGGGWGELTGRERHAQAVRLAGDGPPKAGATIYKETPCDCHTRTHYINDGSLKSECVWWYASQRVRVEFPGRVAFFTRLLQWQYNSPNSPARVNITEPRW